MMPFEPLLNCVRVCVCSGGAGWLCTTVSVDVTNTVVGMAGLEPAPAADTVTLSKATYADCAQEMLNVATAD